MPDAIAVSIAKVVESAISSSSLSQKDFTLQRSYAEWDLDLSKMDALEVGESEKLHVDVVSHTTEQEVELSSRTTMQYMIPIDIAVRKRFGSAHQEQGTGRIAITDIDALILLVQELHVVLTKLRTNGQVKAVWQSSQILAAPVREHLREMRQFTGIIRVIFRADVNI